MTLRFIRWAVAPVLLFALTGCTQLTNADGFTPTPTPSTAPSATANAWLESSAEYGFGLPEETQEPVTKESLPDPAELVPEGVINADSLGDLEATKTQRSLRLPKPVKDGILTVEFVCVDGEITLGNDTLGSLGTQCDGSSQGYSFEIVQGFKSLKMELTVSAGTSYSVAAYQEANTETIID
ncbi:hypothetical protein [Paeniglutamicibacter kerguelensis]|uniref:Uncharacterized protein n=1 Tax=Paeniglutamicibacter kerguelensis TaxID=254788 RepID=A0ABS4XK24_9MICC|nr:hypothetical protein [Paeniglutamicibacter kerguelensis]MBP2388804.1 hypothetical protein [Paeniglutamicibacter kerguelensis]